jgi:thiamine-monophosphate kinase
MSLSSAGEFGLIARWQRQLAGRAGVRLGIGDDAAVLDALNLPLVTCDALVEEVHFRRAWSTPRQIGRKAVAVNVSDIVAMGGRPVAAFVALAAPPQTSIEFLDDLYGGLEDAAAAYSLTIAGGDLTRTPSMLTLALTVVGEAAQPVTRAGARPGDVLIVTGTLGDAAAGLALLQNPALEMAPAARDFLLRRHCEPVARRREMEAALTVPNAVRAALDLSDGLAGDAAHMAERSGVPLEIEAARLPISAPCRAAAAAMGQNALDWALSGGEDYELLLCVRAESAAAVLAAIEATSTPATLIGRCVARGAEGVLLLHEDGRREAAPRAFQHF